MSEMTSVPGQEAEPTLSQIHGSGTSTSWIRANRLARASETNAATARSYLATVPAEIRDKLDNPKVRLSYIKIGGVELLEHYDSWRKDRPATPVYNNPVSCGFEDGLLATKAYLDQVGGVDAALKLIDFMQKLKSE